MTPAVPEEVILWGSLGRRWLAFVHPDTTSAPRHRRGLFRFGSAI